MNVELAVEMYRETLRTAALVAAPILGTAMVVGLTVSLFQALTSLQEQTLTFVPKVAAIAVVVGVALPWILATLTNFLSVMIQHAPTVVTMG